MTSASFSSTLSILQCHFGKFMMMQTKQVFQYQHVVKNELRRMIKWFRMIVIVLKHGTAKLVAKLNCFTFGYLFALINKSANMVVPLPS